MYRVTRFILFALLLAPLAAMPATEGDPLARDFASPPLTARPWVYWFWNNANVTSNGITADLEAMQRVGIGGVLIMDVVERFAPPRGTAEFMNAEWQRLFQFSLQEAARLGLEVNMANGPGWCGSSGAWITPDLSMQKLVWTNVSVIGPTLLNRTLPVPDTSQKQKPGTDVHQEGEVKYQDNYRDIAVLAFPVPTNSIVSREAVVDLTTKLGADGVLNWQVPAGSWTVQRIGHTTTGSSTRPPVAGGSGLECDKLSREAVDAHFAGLLAKLIATAGPLAGNTLTATHIDSWEVGGQDWTPKFREEFKRRRGYDPLPFLPNLTGNVRSWVKGKAITRNTLHVGSKALADRFRWDFQQTISELLADNYAGHLAELAHAHGLRLSIEGYNLRQFGDEGTYPARADEPMSEFWTPSEYGIQVTQSKGRQVASLGHTLGKTIIGAEAFTSGIAEMWKQHPATIKALGDRMFTHGINRFVFHRYQHQPYADRAPGVTMGPWGLHYERTQTWWELSSAWHQYLARCQFLLRQGLFVADLLYLRPELPNQTYFNPVPPPPEGYAYDQCAVETLLLRAEVKDGWIVFTDGMSYRALVVPPSRIMTPALAEKLLKLARAGATVIANGPPPKTSPSLSGYPTCDNNVSRMAGELWGSCNGKTITEHKVAKGRVIWGQPLADILENLPSTPDFTAETRVNWIHRRTTQAEIYFVASEATNATIVNCSFRVAGKAPELWNAETGEHRSAAAWREDNGRITVPLEFTPSGSWFVVFREPAGQHRPNATSNGIKLKPLAEISGPWAVTFDSKRGGSASVAFDQLVNWPDHSEPEIRFHSGTATYRKIFTAPASAPNHRTYLNLGEVQVMAQVAVNGRNCGIAWKPPFRVEITDALRVGDNTLEIHVANLWPNRLIGDASLPETQRISWSTWSPFQPDMPLLRSGMIGPVTVEHSVTEVRDR